MPYPTLTVPRAAYDKVRRDYPDCIMPLPNGPEAGLMVRVVCDDMPDMRFDLPVADGGSSQPTVRAAGS